MPNAFQTMQNRPHVPTNNSMASSKFSYRLIPQNLKYSSKYFACFRSLSYIPPTSRNLLRRNFHVECIQFASLLNVTTVLHTCESKLPTACNTGSIATGSAWYFSRQWLSVPLVVTIASSRTGVAG
jgi:hypothetical protein